MRNLVWCSTAADKIPTALLSKERQFDVILHLYLGDNPHVPLKEGELLTWNKDAIRYYKGTGVEKLYAANSAFSMPMQSALQEYEQFAFLDDDLSFTVEDLNRLFAVGNALRLPLFQPALTRESSCSHLHLMQVPDAVIRKVTFVEIMCPFFSKEALNACRPTFDLNLSGWGLDCFVWPRKVAGECYVIDAIPIGHNRAPSRRQRVMANGKTPAQECEELQKEISKYI